MYPRMLFGRQPFIPRPVHAGIHTPPGETPPGRHARADTLLGRHPPRQTPPRSDTLSPGQTPPLPDGHYSGRHASYWNAFLLTICALLGPFSYCLHKNFKISEISWSVDWSVEKQEFEFGKNTDIVNFYVLAIFFQYIRIVTLSTSFIFVYCTSISVFISDPVFKVLFDIPEGYSPLNSCFPTD